MANHQRAFMPSQKETTYFANFRGEFKLKKRGPYRTAAESKKNGHYNLQRAFIPD
jgi:hypothetical protein